MEEILGQLYAAHECKLNILHTCSLRKLLVITWISRTPKTVVLSRCYDLNVDCSSWKIYNKWKTEESSKIFFYWEFIYGNVGHPNEIRKSWTWRSWKWIWKTRRNSPQTAPAGKATCKPFQNWIKQDNHYLSK